MSPDISRAAAPYRQIAEHYRARITTGDLTAGQRLPTAYDLAATWHVAPRTAHKAMQQLQAEGLVEMSRGSGTRVAPTPQAAESRQYPSADIITAVVKHLRSHGIHVSASGQREDVQRAADALLRTLHIEPT